ncbi:hypothetical protein ACFQWH_10540 [Mycolicibacterium sp. GCM10028919]|uniref:hypothetical protein n=1 Tax=Mycolicibacterium sp. GCM10028919 TaxID=3273401 RepID=UPI0036179626
MTGRGVFCLSGVGTYTKPGLTDVVGVPEELRTMRECLSSIGLTEVFEFSGPERSHRELSDALNEHGSDLDAETLVIYATGHGAVDDGVHLLWLADGGFFRPADFTLRLGTWPNLSEVILIVDACFSEPGIDAAVAEARVIKTARSRIGIWGIGASRRTEVASHTVFAAAFAEAVIGQSHPSWRQEFIDPGRVAEAVNQRLGDRQTVWLSAGHPATPCRVLPNPEFQSADAHLALPLPRSWAARARGVADPSLPGSFFVGREREVADLLGSDNRLIKVTGAPGTGVSALLGRVVLDGHRYGHGAAVRYASGSAAAVRRLGLNKNTATDSSKVLVLDDLCDPESAQWDTLVDDLQAATFEKIIVGVPRTASTAWGDRGQTFLVTDLPEDKIVLYLTTQIRLRVRGISAVDATFGAERLFERCGNDMSVAVAVTKLGNPGGEIDSLETFMAAAERAMDAAGTRMANKLVSTVRAELATVIVSSIAALSSVDPAVSLTAKQWAAVASGDVDRVTFDDIGESAKALRSLIVSHGDGTCARFRSRFMARPGTYPTIETYLLRLPQLAQRDAETWSAVDDGIAPLIARAASSRISARPLLDDPIFLLHAPPALVSAAIRALPSGAERARRSHAWHVVPADAPTKDREFLLRIGSERFDIGGLKNAAYPEGSAARLAWVQPNASRYAQLTRMKITRPHPNAVVATIHDDNTIRLSDPADGRPRTPPIECSARPCDVSAAMIGDRAVVAISCWDGTVFVIDCADGSLPVAVDLPEVRPCGTERTSVALHDGGALLIVRGNRAWVRMPNEDPRLLVDLDCDVQSVHVAGPNESPYALAILSSGVIKRLSLREPEVYTVASSFDPLTMSTSRDSDEFGTIDTSGALRVSDRLSDNVVAHYSSATALALDAGMYVAAGATGDNRSGWLEVTVRDSHARAERLPLDEPCIDVDLHDNLIIVARGSGLFAVRRTPDTVERRAS